MSTNLTDIRFLKGVGEKRALLFNRLGIDTIGALLRYYPRAYEDFSNITPIFDCNVGEKVCVKARLITDVQEHFIRKNMVLYKFTVSDDSANMNITIFNNKYLAGRLHKGSEYLFLGKIQGEGYMLSMSSPEIRESGSVGITPIYPAGSGMTSAAIEKLMKTALALPLEDVLPEDIRVSYNLGNLRDALQNIHFPKSQEALARARRHLVFEELFILRTGLMLLKGKNRATADFIARGDFTNEFMHTLSFPLTNAQKRVISECMEDMASGRIMNRLVEGDVGSGKTAVAAALIHNTVKNGGQCAFMAPTEILAEQHFATLSAMFKDTDVTCTLLTGSVKKREKDKIKQSLQSGEITVAVGTHALISDDVQFNNLALVITDEQHRFGVSQRARLAAKGKRTHTLVMSATPIPRTLGLIIYGDLDLSIIDEYPKGRQKIENYCVESALRERVYGYIKKHLDEGRQGYIVCPMVEENEEIDLCSAEEYYEKITSGAFKDYKVGLLHGQMKATDKDRIMRQFKDGEIDLLVCTTVIEVGIDVPNAAIMVIENAERFGLSQLHQLRGRIGRGKHKSTCIFISDAKGAVAKDRLKVIKENTDGFHIAEEDLRLRGPGDFLGSRQHGLPELKIADIYTDSEMLKLTGMAAANLLESDPRLLKPQNLSLREEIIALYKKLNEN